jgi:hypothetical protein
MGLTARMQIMRREVLSQSSTFHGDVQYYCINETTPGVHVT